MSTHRLCVTTAIFLLASGALPAQGGERSPFELHDVTAEAGLDNLGAVRAVAAADYDADGRPDLVAVQAEGAPLLLHNMGAAGFEPVPGALPAPERGAAGASWVDLDGDRWLDLFIAGGVAGGSVLNRAYRNEKGRLRLVTIDPVLTNVGGGAIEVCPVDVDRDGRIDLLLMTGGGERKRGAGNRLAFHAAGGFRDATPASGLGRIAQTSMTVVHLDEGGEPCYVAVGGEAGAGARVYRRTSNGSFLDVSARLGVREIRGVVAVAPGDYDTDGDIDLYFVRMNGAGLLLRNDQGRLADVSGEAGLGGGPSEVAAAFADLDNDGDLDLVVLSGAEAEGRGVVRLHENRGDGTFEKAGGAKLEGSGKPTGLLVFDYDGDGAQDVLVTAAGSGKGMTLWRNETTCGEWLSIRPGGTNSDPTSMGARVRVFRGQRQIVVERYAVTAPHVTSVLPLHVGLGLDGTGSGSQSVVVEITWPSGHRLRRQVETGQLVEVFEPEGPPPRRRRTPERPLPWRKVLVVATALLAAGLVGLVLARKKG